MEDEKYVVFKRAEVMDLIRGGEVWSHSIEDAVVIRTQDIFAASGLHAYAKNIRAYVEITRRNIQTFGPRVVALSDLFDKVVDNEDAISVEASELRKLEAIAAYFESVAQEAEDRIASGEAKVPD